MNNGDGNVGVGELNQSTESRVIDVALPLEREYLALSLEEGTDDGLDMDSAKVDTLIKGCDLDLAIADRVDFG
jgi:hypothetical protein